MPEKYKPDLEELQKEGKPNSLDVKEDVFKVDNLETNEGEIKEEKPKKPDGYWGNLPIEDFKASMISDGLDPENLPGDLNDKFPAWNSRLKRRFGSLHNARKELGGKVLKKPHNFWKDISEESLIAEIKSRGFDPKNLPPAKQLGDDLSIGLQQRYGSINKAKEILGSKLIKKPDGYWKNISLEDLKKEIELRGLVPNDLPTSTILKEKHTDLVRGLTQRFGDLNKARESLGGKILQKSPGYWKNISEEDLMSEIYKRGLDPQNLPNRTEIEKTHPDLVGGLKSRFGTYNEARIKLGGNIIRQPASGYWEDLPIEDFKAAMLSDGLDPEKLPGDIDNRFPAWNQRLRKRFGGIINARKELGGKELKKPAGYWKEISEEALIQEIESRGFDPKNLPPAGQLGDDLSVGLQQRYGSINKAKEILGSNLIKRSDNFWKEISEEALVQEIESRGLDPKNLPSSLSMQKTDSGLQRGLVQRYGSFTQAREALGGTKVRNLPGYWQNISEKELLKEIESRGLDPKNLPSKIDLAEQNSDLLSGLRRRFGSLTKARELLGGDFSKISPKQFIERIVTNLQETAAEIAKNETLEAQEIHTIASILGNSNYIDILYHYHPEYKKLPVGRVKSILADYLGEFLVSNLPPFNLETMPDKGLELLAEQTFQDSLIEVIKNDALKFFNGEKNKGTSANPEQILSRYLKNLDNIAKHHSNIHLNAVIEKVELYYKSLFKDLHKPENIVEQVKPNRPFPEFYQEINIKELSDKKKVLLADEMGVGKSASAILAKEYLGVKQALIVAPSNVIDTWRSYLSDEVAEDGSQIGYFKPGEAPKILIVDNLEDLDNNGVEYDYILISQERLNKKYAEKLNSLDYGMLIVDEVHKLKNIRSGVRSTHLLDLAKTVNGEEKYLALLSGTPIPNKVEDIAITLKLLYPEEFEQMSNKTLIQRIIHSDTIDLRSKLLPRMQMKKLVETVEMPKLYEQIVDLELSEEEKEIYELLVEEDEMESSEKMRILRQFLLNPELLDATPNIESTKITSVGESLNNTFQDKDKVVMFVNGYITNVIRGDKNIIDQLNLPPEVEVKIIHGDTSKEERILIQKELKDSKKKLLLLVSGQTADVGVDFSSGESVYFYNEPWTRYELKQELFRVYRPGLSGDLESKSFITKDTIEEGIHLYTKAKEQAIEKLLQGLPRSEIENRLLEESENQTDPNLEVNPELARYYFSDWDKMGKIFAYIKEIGQPNFMKFLADFGKDYASCYLNLGSRSYQANADRVSGAIIDKLVKESGQDANQLRILDIASGPEMLKKHILAPYQDRVISMDVNEEHFRGEGKQRAVGSFLKLPFAEQSIDYANFALALHYTQLIPSRNNYERLEALLELNKVLKVGGKAVINMIYSIDFKDENKFQTILEDVGFKIIDEYTGTVNKGRNYKSKVFTLEKLDHYSGSSGNAVEDIGRDNLEGLKFLDNKSSLKDSRKIIDEFELNGNPLKIELNEADHEVLEEEQEILQAGEELKARFGGIDRINKDDVIVNGFTRILIRDKYILFKKLKKGTGVVVIK